MIRSDRGRLIKLIGAMLLQRGLKPTATSRRRVSPLVLVHNTPPGLALTATSRREIPFLECQ